MQFAAKAAGLPQPEGGAGSKEEAGQRVQRPKEGEQVRCYWTACYSNAGD